MARASAVRARGSTVAWNDARCVDARSARSSADADEDEDAKVTVRDGGGDEAEPRAGGAGVGRVDMMAVGREWSEEVQVVGHWLCREMSRRQTLQWWMEILKYV